MAKYPGLREIGGRWVFRRVVPEHLRGVIGKRELKKVLGRDRASALKEYPDVLMWAEEVLRRAKNGTLHPEDVAAALNCESKWYYDTVIVPNNLNPLINNLDSSEQVEEALDSWLSSNGVGLSERVLLFLKKFAHERVQDDQHRVDTAEHAVAVFLELLDDGYTHREAYDRIVNKIEEIVDEERIKNGLNARCDHRASQPGDHETLKLSEMFTKWKGERKPAPKTLREWTTAMRRFQECVGADIRVGDIRKHHIRNFKDDLLQLPASMSNNLRALQLPDILKRVHADRELSERQKLSPAAINKLLGALGSVLQFAVANGYIDSNPTVGIKAIDPEHDADKRLPYTVEELNKIITAPRFYLDRELWGADQWLILLSLYGGERLDELGQLLLHDVREEEGVMYLDINTVDEGKRTKNRASRRKVPVHPLLIRIGFKDYVARLRATKEKQLFPELQRDRMGTMTSAWSKRYSRFRQQLGISDRRKPFHSFRHNFKDAARRVMHEGLNDALCGHHNGSAGKNYGTGYSVVTLYDAISGVNYNGLRIDHLLSITVDS